MSWLRAWWPVCMLLWAACGELREVDAPTQVMLRIHNEDDALLARMTDLRVSLFRRETGRWLARGSNVHSMRQLKWPVEIPILPSSGAAATKDFEVVIEALAGEQVLAETRVVSSFAANDWRILDASLFVCPRAPGLPTCAPAGCHAETCEQCTPQRSCAPVLRVEPTSLPRFDPKLSKPDAAVNGSDAASVEPTTDGGSGWASEAGAQPSDAQVSGSDSAVGVGSDGATEAGTPSDASVGAEASTPSDANSDPADAVLTDPCESMTCTAGATCTSDTGVARCVCKSGFSGDGDVCTPLPSCASLNCATDAECVGTGSALRCQCLSGFDGNGMTCVDRNECTTNNGGCGNPVYNTCTNRRGAAATCSVGGSFGAVQRGPAPTIASTGSTGSYTVMSYTMGFADSPDYGAATIYYPTPFEATPFAALSAVGGFTTTQSVMVPWATWLASHGFIVINIDTNTTSDQPAQRATALYGALETLRQENTRSGSPLLGHVRTTHMGVIGWSMGGGGAMLAASEHSNLKAVVALSPWGGTAATNSVPALILGASADALSMDMPAGLYDALPAATPRLLFIASGGSTSTANTPSGLSGDIGRFGVAWFRVFLDGDMRYRQLLTTPQAATSRFNSAALP
jgi:pimeloyl-ACP methyl ester carboxylesterase